MWEVYLLPGDRSNELFQAIITADHGRMLIAQVTSVEAAEIIVKMYNAHSMEGRAIPMFHETDRCVVDHSA